MRSCERCGSEPSWQEFRAGKTATQRACDAYCADNEPHNYASAIKLNHLQFWGVATSNNGDLRGSQASSRRRKDQNGTSCGTANSGRDPEMKFTESPLKRGEMNILSELQAVIVSRDPEVLRVVSGCLNELGITGVCPQERDAAIQLLHTQKTDAFFVDQELDPELSVLHQMRSSSSSRSAIGFAIVPSTSNGIRACRTADFVVSKPVGASEVRRTLRAAYGMMLKERRRYSRHTLRCEAVLLDNSGRKCLARTTNLSETGIALECEVSLTAGQLVRLKVPLPDNSRPCHFEGRVIWSAANGKAGLVFTHMSSRDRERLTEWIDAEFLRQWHPVIPQSVAATFMHAAH